jgi:hypothetical protein
MVEDFSVYGHFSGIRPPLVVSEPQILWPFTNGRFPRHCREWGYRRKRAFDHARTVTVALFALPCLGPKISSKLTPGQL